MDDRLRAKPRTFAISTLSAYMGIAERRLRRIRVRFVPLCPTLASRRRDGLILGHARQKLGKGYPYDHWNS